MCKDGTFLGFLLYMPVDTNISNDLRSALAAYSGPQVKINSLRRNWNTNSDHERGRAVDLEFCPRLIEYLVSEDGQQWLASNSLSFYIEGKPGSSRVANYLADNRTRPYVFFNPLATGNHVHIEIS